MTDQPKTQRSRRRFLADMLFLGGGLTATALIAKTQFPGATPSDGKTPTVASTPEPACTPVENPPELAGEVIAPEAPNPAGGRRAPTQTEHPPDIEGDFVQPQAQPSPPPRPHIKGKVKAPRPNGPYPGEARPVDVSER